MENGDERREKQRTNQKTAKMKRTEERTSKNVVLRWVPTSDY